LALFLFRASRPHIATVGLVPGTEHFRNVTRHDVLVSPKLVCLRVDASMFFANARGVEDRINAEVAARPALEHVLLQCSAVNDIDASALESLEAIASRLKDSGIALHFSEIKGPVMDKLNTTEFLQHLHGQVFLTNYQAIQALTPEIIQR
jgi:SulP family sulfate permease